MRYLKSGVLTMALALGMSACDDVTGPAGEGTGELRVAAVGNSGGTSASRSPGGPSYSQSVSDGEGRVEGTVHFSARVFVRAQSGQWVELTNRAADSTSVQLTSNAQARTFVSARVNAGSYDSVRVVFQDVRADVRSGLRLTLGTLLTGLVRVDLGSDSQTTVERRAPVTVDGDASSQLVIDLNSEAWLNSANAQTRAASEASFQSAVQVYAR